MSSHLLDDDSDLVPRRDREVTLSTFSILAIFFGLVVLCALFFALGYNMHKTGQPVAANADSAQENVTAAPSSFSHFKPSPGSPGATPAAAPAPAPANSAPVVQQPAAATTPNTAAAAPAEAPQSETATPAPAHTAPPHTAATVPAAEPPPAPPTVAPGAGTFLVQIAAVSHQEDATLLVGALKSKGYAVTARNEPQDKLFHIQVGPFATKKDAETMRQRLLADGYNAIVK